MPNCMFPLAELHVHSHGSSGRWLLPTTIRLSESMSRKSSGWLPSAPAVSPHLSLFNLLSDQHINTLGSISVRVGPRIAVLEFLVIRTPGDTTGTLETSMKLPLVETPHVLTQRDQEANEGTWSNLNIYSSH